MGCKFGDSWADGFAAVVDSLRASGVKSTLSEEQGSAIALRSYVPVPVTKHVAETVYTNTFETSVPASIQVSELERPLDANEQQELRREWAFVEANARVYLAFERPPDSLPLVQNKRLAGYSWKHYKFKHEKRSTNVVRELIRRSLDIACVRA